METLAERGNPVIVRPIFSALISPSPAPKKLRGSFYFFLFHYCLSRHREDEGKSLKKMSGKKTHLAKTQKSSKIICIDPPHQHDCVKRWRPLFSSPFWIVCCGVSFFLFSRKKKILRHITTEWYRKPSDRERDQFNGHLKKTNNCGEKSCFSFIDQVDLYRKTE